MNFAVFASGRGGNLQAIIRAVKSGAIKANLALVFSDNPEAMALTRAQKAKIPAVSLSPKAFSTREDFDRAVVQNLKAYNIDFIVLAGYMRLLSGYFIGAYRNKILNIHPSLIPAFRGAHGIRDAFDYGVKVTGVTVHFVVEEMDAGPIIAQEVVPVLSKDTAASLEAKIHRVEHAMYPKIIDAFARGKITVTGRKVSLRR